MKNHVKIAGRLLQTNKKWSHLKMKQRAWISNLLKSEYKSSLRRKGRSA